MFYQNFAQSRFSRAKIYRCDIDIYLFTLFYNIINTYTGTLFYIKLTPTPYSLWRECGVVYNDY